MLLEPHGREGELRADLRWRARSWGMSDALATPAAFICSSSSGSPTPNSDISVSTSQHASSLSLGGGGCGGQRVAGVAATNFLVGFGCGPALGCGLGELCFSLGLECTFRVGWRGGEGRGGEGRSGEGRRWRGGGEAVEEAVRVSEMLPSNAFHRRLGWGVGWQCSTAGAEGGRSA